MRKNKAGAARGRGVPTNGVSWNVVLQDLHERRANISQAIAAIEKLAR